VKGWDRPTGQSAPSLRMQVEAELAAELREPLGAAFCERHHDEVSRRVRALLTAGLRTTAVFDHSAELALNIAIRE
jgi:hypothetical protein